MKTLSLFFSPCNYLTLALLLDYQKNHNSKKIETIYQPYNIEIRINVMYALYIIQTFIQNFGPKLLS